MTYLAKEPASSNTFIVMTYSNSSEWANVGALYSKSIDSKVRDKHWKKKRKPNNWE